MKKLVLILAAISALLFTSCEDENDDTQTYTVTFDSNGGTEVASQTIEEGDTVVIPTAPTKDDSIFSFWSLDGTEYDFSTAVSSSFTLVAQWTAEATTKDTLMTGFEDVTLNSDGLNLNDSTSGSIASGDLSVTCTWYSYDYGTYIYSYGAGFFISNQTDTTNAGYTNAYSCVAQSGADESDNYAVYYSSSDSIKFNSPVDMSSVMLNNTAYTYDCLKNGNAYSTAFTTDDYFYVTFTLYSEDGTSIGSKDFYLADFTDGNSTIISDWTKFDLSEFSGVSYIKFSFTSSDTGDYGINTPTYFCIDNITYFATDED